MALDEKKTSVRRGNVRTGFQTDLRVARPGNGREEDRIRTRCHPVAAEIELTSQAYVTDYGKKRVFQGPGSGATIRRKLGAKGLGANATEERGRSPYGKELRRKGRTAGAGVGSKR
ncbi:hypothetical protein KM043_006292 [Ampulex compressa]|nr:hypothetical protein KM043_006292 [Ampulex compressa]